MIAAIFCDQSHSGGGLMMRVSRPNQMRCVCLSVEASSVGLLIGDDADMEGSF